MSDTPGSRWPFSVSVVIPALNEEATIQGPFAPMQRSRWTGLVYW